MASRVVIVSEPDPLAEVVESTPKQRVVLLQPDPRVKVLDAASGTRVVLVQLGTPGPPGPRGVPGPSGGRNPITLELTDVSSWTFTHDFPYLPDVRLIAQNDEEVSIGVKYPAEDVIFIEFPAPFTGRVILS